MITESENGFQSFILVMRHWEMDPDQDVAQSAGAVEYTDCKTPPNECPGYDTKQYDGEVPVMLELLGIWSTPLLPSLAGPLWHGVVAPDKGPIYGFNRTKWWLEFTGFFLHLNCVFMLNCLI